MVVLDILEFLVYVFSFALCLVDFHLLITRFELVSRILRRSVALLLSWVVVVLSVH